LERLRNRGLIKERENINSIFDNRKNRDINVRNHFIITDKGRRYLNAINQRGLGKDLEKIAKRKG
jgi:hypothetical protein